MLRHADHRPLAKRTGDPKGACMEQEPMQPTLEVVVEAVGQEAYRYDYDAAARAVRLAGVAAPEGDWPADLGTLPDTLGPDGQPVPVLLLGRHPTFPGCRVAALPVGLLEAGTADRRRAWVLAVPAADPPRAALAADGALPPDLQRALERAMRRELARDGAEGSLRWGEAAAALALVREARRAHRMAVAAHARARATPPRWEVRDRTLRRATPGEAERHTGAEYAVYALPYRFQEYARDCLLPEERLLCYVQRAPLRHGGVWGLLRQPAAQAGLVAVTDQQVLLLTDAMPPGHDVIYWGYAVRSAPVERVVDATVRAAGKLAWLEITLATSAGPGDFRVEFAAEEASGAEEVAAWLRRFRPVANTRRPMRRYAVAPRIEPPSVEAFLTADTVADLERQLADRLAPDEPLLARAIAPATTADAPTLLVAATPRRLVVVEREAGRRGPLPAEIPLDAVAAVELRNALLAPHFRLWLGDTAAPTPLEVRFPYPVVRPFLTLFLTVRRLLATPPGASVPLALEQERAAPQPSTPASG